MSWAQRSHHSPQLYYATGITSLSNHLVNPSHTQARVSVKRLLYEIQIRLNQRHSLSRAAFETLCPQRASDGVRMESKLTGYCPNLPMLGVEQTANHRNLFVRD